MNKKSIIILIVAIAILIFSIYSLLNLDPCSDIDDSSAKATCYIDRAIKEKDISYCNLDYYTQNCLEKADPNFKAKKQDVENLCDQIIDSSTKKKCHLHVMLNY
ncbi:MAG: hypothetical protein ABII18_05190 [bacterium]